MSRSYDATNLVSSLGFSWRWRHQATATLRLRPGDQVADLMTGIGECWSHLRRRVGPAGCIVAVDFSHGMVHQATRRLLAPGKAPVHLLLADALRTPLPDACLD